VLIFKESRMSTEQLLKTPLHALHLELGARMVPFAGYDMPVQYPLGVMKEHQHTREQAGLFDVSHMGQIRLTRRRGQGPGSAGAGGYHRPAGGHAALCHVHQ
jgi:hypothetical protein